MIDLFLERPMPTALSIIAVSTLALGLCAESLVAALWWFTPPTDCSAKYYATFTWATTTGETPPTLKDGWMCVERTTQPWPHSPGFYDCEGWTRAGVLGSFMSCEKFDAENPPRGQVWFKEYQ